VQWPERFVRLAAGAWFEFTNVEIRQTATGESQSKHPALVTDQAWLARFEPIDTITID
jgi:hypothetical protein